MNIVLKLLLGCLLFSSVCLAELPKLINIDSVLSLNKSVTLKEYPNADEVLLDEYQKTIYNADGTYKTYDDVCVKVLTEKGKRSNRQVSFYYSLPYATVTIECLEVIKPSGEILTVDIASNSREVINRSQMSANIYNPNSKILQASIPGLEIGDIVHYITFRDAVKPRVPNTFSDYSVFEYDLPILNTTYEVIAPADKPLVNIELKDDVKDSVTFSETKNNDTIVYKWVVADVPKAFPEPSMPAMHTVVQRLLVSTIDDWQDISKWYWELCLPHIEATTPAMKTKVEELVSGCSNNSEKITNIFNFVSQDIRYMGITPEKESPGYEPHDSSMTFDNRYGVCRDKATLLVSMLRLAGFEAFPIIINAGPKKDEEVPQPYFNHAITALKGDNGEYILMDSTDESTKRLLPSYLSDCSYLVATPEGDPLRTSPIIPAKENMMMINNLGSIDENGTLLVNTKLNFNGINDNAYRGYFAKQKPEDVKKYFERVLSGAISGVKVKDFEIQPVDMLDTSVPLSVELSYSVENYIKGNDTVAVIKPPSLGVSVGMINFVIGNTGLQKRKYPMKIQTACGVRESFDLKLDGCVGKPIEIPDFTNITSKVVTYGVKFDASTDSLKGNSIFTMNVVEMSPKEYLEFKTVLKALEYEGRKEFLFESLNGVSKNSDIEVVYSRRKVELSDKSNWKTKISKRLTVLTYGGKKNFSEIKIAYNPIWQEVNIDSAKVIGQDGSVKEITDLEINIMDAGWAGAAPRYPAGKTLVMSLPGVEIGSTIEYEISSINKDKLFFAEDMLFASSNPCKEKNLTVIAPKSCSLDIINFMDEYYTVDLTNVNDMVEYHFAAEDMQGVVRERSTPPWWSFNPNFSVSTSSWQEFADLIKNAVDDKMILSSEVSSIVKELVKDKKTDREKVLAIRDYVLKNIRIAGPSFVNLPLTNLSKPEITLKDGYGHSLDRAILLKSMLDVAEIKADIILVSGACPTEPTLRAESLKKVNANQFSTALVKVMVDNHVVYINSGSFYDYLGTTD
jgi:transglutaminase-like putative cysteine protease